ncbi:DegP protease 1 isoform 2 [Theobroma cacao]|uniref:DegP protease 1 isoform 2 n=1 Tax=Theobroma cacao TaxID=3641 RepID=A0A061EBM6_THECC|nr:DegP protease 1 isoform 2 [Theobroma cacao]
MYSWDIIQSPAKVINLQLVVQTSKTAMAAYSLLSSLFLQSPSPSSPYSRSPNRTPKLPPLPSLSLPPTPRPSFLPPSSKLSLSSLHNLISSRTQSNTASNSCDSNRYFASALDSLFLLCTSLALSFSLFVTDVGPASAFVVTAPRKLQSDELATVRLFQENTPSVVYITNLAVRVTLADQSTYDAKVVGFDQDKDVAVLRVDAPKDKLRPIPIGISADLLVGQKVYAIGNPFGLDHTLTTGVISGLRREISSAATGRPIQDVIQTDAAINPGNSGGPLLDSSGNLIGINTAIYSPSGASSGVGFSIPVDTVGGIVDQLVKFGKVTRPVLGIKFAPDQSVEQLGVSGVLVLDAPANGPAGKAGLQPTKRDSYGRLILGDIITSVNGKKVTSGSDLYRILDQCKVGEQVTVEVLRGDHKEKIPVILEPKPDES